MLQIVPLMAPRRHRFPVCRSCQSRRRSTVSAGRCVDPSDACGPTQRRVVRMGGSSPRRRRRTTRPRGLRVCPAAARGRASPTDGSRRNGDGRDPGRCPRAARVPAGGERGQRAGVQQRDASSGSGTPAWPRRISSRSRTVCCTTTPPTATRASRRAVGPVAGPTPCHHTVLRPQQRACRCTRAMRSSGDSVESMSKTPAS